jgi:hypothetical protein
LMTLRRIMCGLSTTAAFGDCEEPVAQIPGPTIAIPKSRALDTANFVPNFISLPPVESSKERDISGAIAVPRAFGREFGSFSEAMCEVFSGRRGIE